MAKWLKLYAIYTFSTQPNSCHYTTLLKAGVLNVYLTLDMLQSDCSVFVSAWRGQTVADNFLAQRPLPNMRWWSGDDFFYVSTKRHLDRRISTRHRRFPGATEMWETRRCLGACVRVRGAHFEHEFWQFWADLSWQLITLLNKPYFSLLCANSVVR